MNGEDEREDVADDQDPGHEDRFLGDRPRLAGACAEGEDRRHEEADRGDHEERRVRARDARVEALDAVAEAAEQDARAEDEEQVPDDRAGERRLHDLDEPGLEGEEGDDQLGDVAERGVEDAAHLGSRQRAETLGGQADEPGEPEDRDGRDDEDEGRVGPEPPVEHDRSRGRPRSSRARGPARPGTARRGSAGGRSPASWPDPTRPVRPVEAASRDPGGRRHAARGVAPGGTPGDQPLDLGPGTRQRRRPRPHRPPRRPPVGAPTRRVVADHDHHLAAGDDRPRRPPPRRGRPSVPRRTSSWIFVSSRQTAAGRSGAARGGEIRQRRRRAARAPRRGPSCADRPPTRARRVAALAARARQEPLERPARAGDPRRDERRQHGRRARDRHDGAALGRPRRDELAAGVRDERRAGVGDEGEVGPAAQVREQLGAARGGVAGVVADEARGQAVAGEQAPRAARCPRRPRGAPRRAPRAPAA